MNTTKLASVFLPIFIVVLALMTTSCMGQGQGQGNKNSLNKNSSDHNSVTKNQEKKSKEQLEDDYLEEMEKRAQTDHGKGYKIDRHMLYPEKKLICTEQMYGTATKDCVGYFPNPSLKYDEDTLVIFGGMVFFDKFDLDINWKTVRLLESNGSHYFSFTDGQFWYSFNDGNIYKHDRNIPVPTPQEVVEDTNQNKKMLTADFYIANNRLYYNDLPVLESLNAKKLHTISSANGFKTDFITDGKVVILDQAYYSNIEEKNGKEFASIKECMIEGIDFASLRILGKNILTDKNALYYDTSVIPFTELKGLKIILREM